MLFICYTTSEFELSFVSPKLQFIVSRVLICNVRIQDALRKMVDISEKTGIRESLGCT